jgi:phage terminase large subunit
MMEKEIEIPIAFQDLFRPYRFKIYYGGRGSGKSWSIAQALILKSLQGKYLILCAREFQASIADSVHQLLKDQIGRLGFSQYFHIGKTMITSAAGSSFIFKGLRMNPQEIKSTEGVDICWVEEAQSVSEESWRILTPTIRKEKSQIWASFNPLNETDPTYQRFVVNQYPNSVVIKVNWDQNPYFPSVLNEERLHMLRTDPTAYQHIWEGDVLRISDAVIFKNKFEVSAFETPENARFYHGADWGFANDPACLIRCFIDKNILYVDREAWGVGVDIDELPALFDSIETARTWPIKADCSRPETISYIRKRGFNISAAAKWGGCIEDRIAFLRSFKKIVIHEKCKHTAENFRLYSYKVDRQTGDVLPIIVDAHNHAPDSIGYAFDGLIKGRGNLDERMKAYGASAKRSSRDKKRG